MKKTFIVLLAVFGLPLVALAAPETPGPATGSKTPYASSLGSLPNILNFICTIFDWMFYFLIALAVLFIVIAAYRYLTASGNAEKVKGATNTIIYAAIAVGVALLAVAIPMIVASFLGVQGNIGACSSGSSGSTPSVNSNINYIPQGS